MEIKKEIKELKILKIMLGLYILLALILAGLNYGYVSKAPLEVGAFITRLWHFYENWIKTIFIIIGSFLTLRIIGASQRSVMRKRNLIGFIVAALIVHIITPILLHNQEIYFFAMPLPWTTTPLQLLYPHSTFYLSRFPLWGVAGISAVAGTVFYLLVDSFFIRGTGFGEFSFN